MERIDWNPSFSVGVRLLDQQHEQIVAMINLLISEPGGGTVRSETISELLTKLTMYASDHFLAEERLLEEHRYPALASQQGDHKAYRLKIVALCRDTMDYKDSVPAELLEFMKEWWIRHILETDMQYRSFLVERGVK